MKENNIDAYKVLSLYYDDIYVYQKPDRDTVNVDEYLKSLMELVAVGLDPTSALNPEGRFLDVGCGTGIYTNKLCKHFVDSYGIDPCSDMLSEAIKNEKIIYENKFLHEFVGENFDLISAYTQILNHLTSIEELEDFIRDVSRKLSEGGIFNFDVFNYDFMLGLDWKALKNKNDVRELKENCFYTVNPSLIKKDSLHIEMKLENFITEGEEAYPYNLNIYIWNMDLIYRLCRKYNLSLIKKTNMFEWGSLSDNTAKNSLIFKKQVK